MAQYKVKDGDDVVEVTKVNKDTVIKSPYGDVTVTEGNYIVKNEAGDVVGCTPDDLKLNYTKVPTKKK